MKSIHSRLLAASTAGICLAWASPGLAQVTSTTPTPTTTEEPAPVGVDLFPVKTTADFLDLTASLGYQGNPFFQDSRGGSVVARASARGIHSWRGELSRTSISGFVEGSSYFNEYGLKTIFAVDGHHSRRVSENVTVYGSLGASGDISGQLSNRFLNTDPIIVDPALPPPPTDAYDPDFFSFTGKQYRLHGQVGASIRVSERGSLSVSGGAQRILHTGSSIPDYTSLFGHVGYNHTLSERTSAGFSVSATRTNYDQSSDDTTIITPSANVRSQLSEDWFVNASVGVSFSDVNRFGGSRKSTNLTASGSVCNVGEENSFCAHASRTTNSSGFSSLVTTTSAGVDWSHRFGTTSSIKLSAGYTHYDQDTVLNTKTSSSYWRGAASYDRRLNLRLSAGVQGSVRAFSNPGPNPNTDFSGSAFIRYHLGDLG